MPAAVEGSAGVQPPDSTDKTMEVVELSLHDLIVHHFTAEYHMWSGTVDLDSDEELELDPKYQQDVEQFQRWVDEVKARSDRDWQREADEQYDEAMQRWQEAEDEPEPEVPSNLQARLDEVKAFTVPEELEKFKQTLVDSILREVPHKTRLAKPTKDDWQKLKRDSIRRELENLESAQRRLESERRQLEYENTFVRALRAFLQDLDAQAG